MPLARARDTTRRSGGELQPRYVLRAAKPAATRGRVFTEGGGVAARLSRGAEQPGRALCAGAGLCESGGAVQELYPGQSELRSVLSQSGTPALPWLLIVHA